MCVCVCVCKCSSAWHVVCVMEQCVINSVINRKMGTSCLLHSLSLPVTHTLSFITNSHSHWQVFFSLPPYGTTHWHNIFSCPLSYPCPSQLHALSLYPILNHNHNLILTWTLKPWLDHKVPLWLCVYSNTQTHTHTHTDNRILWKQQLKFDAPCLSSFLISYPLLPSFFFVLCSSCNSLSSPYLSLSYLCFPLCLSFEKHTVSSLYRGTGTLH